MTGRTLPLLFSISGHLYRGAFSSVGLSLPVTKSIQAVITGRLKIFLPGDWHSIWLFLVRCCQINDCADVQNQIFGYRIMVLLVHELFLSESDPLSICCWKSAFAKHIVITFSLWTCNAPLSACLFNLCK